MWWSWNSDKHGRILPVLSILMTIGFILFISRGASWWIWPVMFWLVPSLLFKVFGGHGRSDEHKRKHDEDYADEKPKHIEQEPRYALGDDGEIIDLGEERRQHNGYV